LRDDNFTKLFDSVPVIVTRNIPEDTVIFLPRSLLDNYAYLGQSFETFMKKLVQEAKDGKVVILKGIK
jgi:hypothetical protein